MKTMTKEQFAELLNGNEYRDEMTKEQEQIALLRRIEREAEEREQEARDGNLEV